MSEPRLSPPAARGLLDTSVVIDLDEIPVAGLPADYTISTITLAELAAGPHATDHFEERSRRQDRLQKVESLFESLPFDADAARAYGRVYAATLASGRKPRGTRSVDLLIASVALAHGLPLFTRNPGDFEYLQGIGLELHSV